MTEEFLNNQLIECEDTKENCIGYKEYMNSLHWKRIRNSMIKKNTVCSLCGSSDTFQVHHITYKRLGHENKDTDIIVLCKKCHRIVHSDKEAKRFVKLKFSQNEINKNNKSKKTMSCKNCYYSSKKMIQGAKGKNKELYCEYNCIVNPKEICKKYRPKRNNKKANKRKR